MLWITAAWGACFLAIQWGLRDAPLLWFAALRALIAGGALLALSGFQRRPTPDGPRAWALGVSRSAAQIWKNGTTVRGRDGTVRVVPPLEPRAVRPISPRFLSEEERIRIADMASRGDGPTVIGKALGRAPSTISRELRRNLHPTGQYRPFHAQRQAAHRRRRPKALKLTLNRELHGLNLLDGAPSGPIS